MTQCTSKAPLSDEAIVQAINDEAPPAVIRHLATCEACRQRYAMALQVETVLQQVLFRFDCPSPVQLATLAEGHTDPAIQTHLKHCPRCRRELASYHEFMGDSSDMPRATLPEPMPRMIYAMQPMVQSAAPVLRGAQSGAVIHKADEGTQLFLSLIESGKRWLVKGYLNGNNPAEWHQSLVIVRQDDVIRATGVNARGFFSIVVPKDTDIPFQFRITRPDSKVLLVDSVRLAKPAG